MGRGRPAGGRPSMAGGNKFYKGQNGGPGRTKLTDEQKEIAKLIQRETGKLLIGKFWFGEYGEIQKALKKKSITAGELFIARLFEKGIAQADYRIVSFIFDRLGWTADDINKKETMGSIRVIVDKDDSDL